MYVWGCFFISKFKFSRKMINCPLCTDEFKNRKGLNIHISKCHKDLKISLKKSKESIKTHAIYHVDICLDKEEKGEIIRHNGLNERNSTIQSTSTNNELSAFTQEHHTNTPHKYTKEARSTISMKDLNGVSDGLPTSVEPFSSESHMCEGYRSKEMHSYTTIYQTVTGATCSNRINRMTK
jgi:uncharacterized C2H2 Zn-finger protein